MKDNLLDTVALYDVEQITTEVIEKAAVENPVDDLRRARQGPFVPYSMHQSSSDSDEWTWALTELLSQSF